MVCSACCIVVCGLKWALHCLSSTEHAVAFRQTACCMPSGCVMPRRLSMDAAGAPHGPHGPCLQQRRSLNALADAFEPRGLRSISLPVSLLHSSLPPSPESSTMRPIRPASVPGQGFGRRKHFSNMTYSETDATPQASLQGNGNGVLASAAAFDPFVTASTPLAAASAVGPVQANPYAHDGAALGGAAFFASQSGFQQPVRCLSFPLCVSCSDM